MAIQPRRSAAGEASKVGADGEGGKVGEGGVGLRWRVRQPRRARSERRAGAPTATAAGRLAKRAVERSASGGSDSAEQRVEAGATPAVEPRSLNPSRRVAAERMAIQPRRSASVNGSKVDADERARQTGAGGVGVLARVGRSRRAAPTLHSGRPNVGVERRG
jgi:hypothetical protein